MRDFNRAVFAALLAAAIPVAAAAAPAKAAGGIAGEVRGVALGAFLGQPTGFTCRLGLAGDGSIEAKAAWDLAGSGDKAAAFTFQANYLVEFPGVLIVEGHDIPPYVGGGAQLDIGSDTFIGLRAPVGLVYRMKKVPFEFCIELGLGMGLVPSTKPMISGGLGARYIIKGKR
jgi:hypothetical protein